MKNGEKKRKWKKKKKKAHFYCVILRKMKRFRI